MLCLTRRIGEALLIEGGIRVVVLGVSGRKVELGVEAPEETTIMREDVCDEDLRRTLAAAPAVAGVLPYRPGPAVRVHDGAA